MTRDGKRTGYRAICAIGLACAWPASGLVVPAHDVVIAAEPPTRDPKSWSHWQDGRAELNGYSFAVSRYGHPRRGSAVLIYVTEPFSRSRHVKLDDPAKQPGDAVEVLKLNLVRRFQTGIYDYHTMLSVFARSTDFVPLKIAFTSSEWCGQVYEELNFAGGRLAANVFSYFEGESASETLAVPAGGIAEDDLFITLRGLRGDFLAPGARRSVPFLPGSFHRRLTHQKLEWTTASIERSRGVTSVRVPAGTFASIEYVVRPADGRVGRFLIERAAPHRVIRWAWTAAERGPRGSFLGGAESAELTGTLRAPYWTQQRPEDEALLRKLGL